MGLRQEASPRKSDLWAVAGLHASLRKAESMGRGGGVDGIGCGSPRHKLDVMPDVTANADRLRKRCRRCGIQNVRVSVLPYLMVCVCKSRYAWYACVIPRACIPITQVITTTTTRGDRGCLKNSPIPSAVSPSPATGQDGASLGTFGGSKLGPALQRGPRRALWQYS